MPVVSGMGSAGSYRGLALRRTPRLRAHGMIGPSMAPRRSRQRISNRLVALGSTAVLAVYAAGYARTRAAAQKFEGQSMQRRAAAPVALETAAAIVAAPPPAAAPSPVVEHRHPPARSQAAPHDVPARPNVAHAEEAHRPAPPPAPVVAVNPVEAAPPAEPPAAPPVPTAIVAPRPPVPAKWKDGTYYGWGTSRHGDIQAEVVVAGGKITSASIARCLTRYSCSWIAHLPPQVVVRQSEDVDYVSGATESTFAFYFAVIDALSKAK